jgi:hypothetical protein
MTIHRHHEVEAPLPEIFNFEPSRASLKISELGCPMRPFARGGAGIGSRQSVEMTRSRTPANPALSKRNIEICQRVITGNDVLISSVELGLVEASQPR